MLDINAETQFSDTNGWGLDLQSFYCDSCKSVFRISSVIIEDTMLCPFCIKDRLLKLDKVQRDELPEMAVEFQLSEKALSDCYANFVKGIWLRTNDLNSANLLQRTKKIYLPMWLVDGTVSGHWDAEAGFDYQVKSTQEYFSNGGWHTRDVIETRVRWESRIGQILRRFSNIVSPALHQHSMLTDSLGGFDLKSASPYQASIIKNAMIQVPDMQPENTFSYVRDSFIKIASKQCQKAADAQHMRNFELKAEYDALEWTQLLIPVFSTFFKDDKNNLQLIMVNGQSGKIFGPRLSSQRKGWIYGGITASIAAVFLIMGIIMTLLTAVLPPALIVGVILIAVSLVLMILAVVPVVIPWQWNRKQKEIRIYQQKS